MKKNNIITLVVSLATLILGFGIAKVYYAPSTNAEENDEHVHAQNKIWTCSMHPQIQQKSFGKCPLCGMDLIPLEGHNQEESDQSAIKMSPTAMQLAQVSTSIVQKSMPSYVLRLDGKVQKEEQRIATQTSHIAGRIEQLLLNTTGEYVQKGQVIAYIYSPELVTAQQELFIAQKMKSTNPVLFEAAKEKLRNWKLTEKQIQNILDSGIVSERFPILSDLTGVVLQKNVQLGDHIKRGTALYQIADLSRLWVLFDVYESDLQWVQVGKTIEYTLAADPGITHKGKITFIDPELNPVSRVTKVRVNLNNSELKYKPEMFASGYLKDNNEQGQSEIIIPKSAVMWTGKTSVVYVKDQSIGGASFTMRQVTLGASVQAGYIVLNGIKQGEEIVVEGAFSIDAAAQLAGKPSMMNVLPANELEEGSANMEGFTDKNSPLIVEQFRPVLMQYFKLKDALVKGEEKKVFTEIHKLEEGFDLFRHNLPDEVKNQFNGIAMGIEKEAESQSLTAARNAFILLSDKMIVLANQTKIMEQRVYVAYCPMANSDKGASWLSLEENIENPYFGAQMLSCGEVLKVIE